MPTGYREVGATGRGVWWFSPAAEDTTQSGETLLHSARVLGSLSRPSVEIDFGYSKRTLLLHCDLYQWFGSSSKWRVKKLQWRAEGRIVS